MSPAAGRRERYPPSYPLTSATRGGLTMTAIPDGAACYFCLGVKADEEGMPLVRDCSCRGGSAGTVLSRFSPSVIFCDVYI